MIKPIEKPTSGTYTLKFDNLETNSIDFDASDVTINAALAAANINDVVATGQMNDPAGITITFT